MTDAPDNPAAFPTSINNPGMTLRDWFAGQAALPAIGLAEQTNKSSTMIPVAARLAYAFADAMLAARKAQP